jgi:hypothetical protein
MAAAAAPESCVTGTPVALVAGTVYFGPLRSRVPA